MSDLLFRGRGAEIGTRAPAWKVRVAGTLLGLALGEFLHALGVFSALGMGVTWSRLLCGGAGALIAPTAVGAWLWGATGLATAVLLIVSYTPVVRPLFTPFVRRDAVSAVRPPDAVMVLSGAVTSEGRVSGDALDRLLTALAEVNRRRLPVLALSVVGDERDVATPDSERDQREMAERFAPGVTVHFVHRVFSTRDEALAFAALARTHGWRRVLVVTSPAHTRRACGALEVAGLEVDCLPAVSRSFGPSRLASAEDRRLAFADVVYESAATLLYRIRGWL